MNAKLNTAYKLSIPLALISMSLFIWKSERTKEGAWPLQAKHPGQTHVDMEKPGKPSRWNTLRALRVLKNLD